MINRTEPVLLFDGEGLPVWGHLEFPMKGGPVYARIEHLDRETRTRRRFALSWADEDGALLYVED